jgi:DNA-binding MarR family transcriptional regulator
VARDLEAAASGEDEATWRDLAVVVHDLARRLKPQSIALARVGALSPTTAEVLRIVASRPGVRVHEIAAEAMLQRTNTSTAVAELCRRGLARKANDPADGRQVRIYPTERAVAEGRRVEAAWGQLYHQAISTLDDDQVAALHAATSALRALDARLSGSGTEP